MNFVFNSLNLRAKIEGGNSYSYQIIHKSIVKNLLYCSRDEKYIELSMLDYFICHATEVRLGRSTREVSTLVTDVYEIDVILISPGH